MVLIRWAIGGKTIHVLNSHYEARKRMEKELDDCLEGVNRTRMMEVSVGRVEMM